MNPDPHRPQGASFTAPERLPSSVLLVIPVYNHGMSIREVTKRALAAHPHVLVVDDGSDPPVAAVLEDLAASRIRLEKNGGKGAAVLRAAAWARDAGFSHILTLDADGQHDPAEVHRFAPALIENPDAVIVGARDFGVPNVPGASRFGRSFSGFWMRVQTGLKVSDMQSGFRLYPVPLLLSVPCAEKGFAFEVEILVRAVWSGFALREVPVSVHYPPPGQRVSHFRALYDNFRLSCLNTKLTARTMLPLPHRRLHLEEDGRISPLRPMESLRLQLTEHSSPANLALSAAVGIFLTVLPIIGLQVISILLVCGYFRLNKYFALALNQLGFLPVLPALAVEVGHYCLRGHWLTELSWRTLASEAPQRLFEWVVGSVALAPFMALLFGAATFLLAFALRPSLLKQKQTARVAVRPGKKP